MIVDSSAVVAVLLREPGYTRVEQGLASAIRAGIGAPTLAETGIVLSARLGLGGRTLLSRFLEEAGLVVVPFGEPHWGVAVEAFSRFGKGRHAAAFNFGDCMSYATASLADEPLLCVGDDFAKTDLALAL
ncbi:MAG: type II toxin-antitoxin system VapC family toxin [Actinomycetota bacterium]|nr:type II toxin-antitoxin system VapC family toxin [Actinomycetota bacterium]